MAYFVKKRFVKDDFCMIIDQDKTIYIYYKKKAYREVFDDESWNSQLLFTLTDDNMGSLEDEYIDNREIFLSIKTCYTNGNIRFEENYRKGSCAMTFILRRRHCRLLLYNKEIMKKNDEIELLKLKMKKLEDKIDKLTNIIYDNNLLYLT